MSILSNLFTKARNSGVFSIVFPNNAPPFKAREYLESYRGWVAACVSKIAKEVATIELKLQKKQGSDWVDVPSHPAMDLLARPNPFTTSDYMYEATSSYIDLEGNAFWYVVRNAKANPTELWPLDPTKVTIIRDAKTFIGGYKYQTAPGNFVNLETWEVLHFKTFNPLDPYRGIGVVQQAAIMIDSDQYAAEYNRNFFYNSAMPAAVLSTEGTLDTEQYDRIREQWSSQYQGVANAHKTAILEGGLKFTPITLSQKDMDFLSQRKYDRDAIFAMFGVPKSILGITEDVNRANGENDARTFGRFTVGPRYRFLTTNLTEFYLPLWGLKPSQYRIIANDPVPLDPKVELQKRQIALQTGHMTRNEIRDLDGLKPIEGGDELLVPNNLVTLKRALEPPAPPVLPGANPNQPATPQDTKPKKELKAVEKRVEARAVFFATAIERAQKDLERILARQQRAVVSAITTKALKKSDNPNAAEDGLPNIESRTFASWDDWAVLFAASLASMAEPALAYGGKATVEATGIAISFDLANPRAVAYLRDRSLSMAKNINDGVKEQLRQRLVEGVEQGKSIAEIAKDLGDFYDQQSQWRALRIARTEVLAAYAEGSLEGARQAGLEEKRWITAPGHKDTDECDENQRAGWIEREQSFPSGKMAVPNHPNCQCDIVFRLKPPA